MVSRSWSKAAGGFIAPGLAFALTATYVPWMPDPNVARWGIVYLAALLSCIALWRAKLDRVDLASLLFLGWCWLTLAWSPDRLGSIDGLEKLTAAVVVFLGLRRVERDWIVPAAVSGVGLAALLGLAYAGSGNPEFLTQFALLAIPLLFPVSIFALLCASGMVAAIIFTPSLIPLTVIGAFPLILPKWWMKAVAFSFLLAGAVFVYAHSIDAQVGIGTRLDSFAGTTAAWLAHPLTGWGFGSFAYVFPSYQGTGAMFGLMPLSVEARTFPNAAHNEFLQLGMETGLVGVLLATWILLDIWHWIDRPSRYALGIALILCLTGFPMQNPVTALLVAVAAARVSPMGAFLPAAPVAVMGALASLILLTGVPSAVIAQAHYSAARRYYAADVIPEKASAVAALSHLMQAYELNPSDTHIRLGVFQATALTYARFPSPGSRAAVDEAWKIAQSASPDDTLSLLTRLQFLIAQKECFGSRECDRLANELVRTASRKAEVRKLMEVYG